LTQAVAGAPLERPSTPAGFGTTFAPIQAELARQRLLYWDLPSAASRCPLLQPEHGGSAKMKLICAHCKKTLKTFHDDDLSACLYKDDGVYFFCSRDCKEKWSRPVAPQTKIDSRRQPSI
jgi:hypothetical protein